MLVVVERGTDHAPRPSADWAPARLQVTVRCTECELEMGFYVLAAGRGTYDCGRGCRTVAVDATALEELMTVAVDNRFGGVPTAFAPLLRELVDGVAVGDTAVDHTIAWRL